MEFIAVDKVQKIIDHVYKTDDLKLIASYINELKHELKRDELFVLEIFSQLSDESVYNYQKALDYLDGAIYMINLYETLKQEENFDDFFDYIKLGWTNIDYDDFVAFRSLKYRDSIECETTDLYTDLLNEASDEGYEDISDYIDEIYKSIENFCVETLQAYYCENLEESISDFRKF
tara:strand:- start:24 stop:551 length:528 start_codon:yes stop_codon:yes gene_type:complete